MIRRWPAALLSLFIASGTWAADSSCQFEQVPVGPQKMGAWIDKSNWLAIENQRVSLQASEVFMPSWRMPPSGVRQIEPAKLISVDDFQAADPLDDSRRNLGLGRPPSHCRRWSVASFSSRCGSVIRQKSCPAKGIAHGAQAILTRYSEGSIDWLASRRGMVRIASGNVS